MRAIRFDGDRVVLDGRAPSPQPGPGQVLIRPLRMGVGEADLHAIIRGQPGILGREFVGVVEAIGPGADSAWIGRRVVASPGVACGGCDLCRRGLSRHCRSLALLGEGGHDGCFAEQLVVPAINLVEVPETVDDDAAVFAWPLGMALHTAHMLRVEGKPYVTVLGDRALGLLTAQVMSGLNASVRLLGFSRRRLELCEKWGIKHRHADDAGRRADQDAVVVCTARPVDAQLALELVRPRGTVVLTMGCEGVPLGPIVKHELQVLGARSGSVSEAVVALAGGRYDVHSLITRRVRFEDGPTAVAAAREVGQIKVLLDAPRAVSAAA